MKVWLAFFPFLITTCTAITKKRCQFDTKTKAKLNKLLPMLLELSVDVLKTKETIEKRWVNDNYQVASVESIVTPIQQLQATKKTTPQSTLEVNYRILKVFLPLIRTLKRQLSAFSVARDVTYQLQEIRWKVENTMIFVRAIQNALKPGQPQTSSLRPSTTAVSNSTLNSVSGVPIVVQTPTTAAPSAITLYGVAVKASAMLEDFYTEIVVMQVDLVKPQQVLDENIRVVKAFISLTRNSTKQLSHLKLGEKLMIREGMNRIKRLANALVQRRLPRILIEMKRGSRGKRTSGLRGGRQMNNTDITPQTPLALTKPSSVTSIHGSTTVQDLFSEHKSF
ncbi:uncharacterized protein LOC113673860 [Pocillopora damicornis]|uniref:uncharacterized protein LOC113673860 n=1 Tax=Pocillopora damicornis TaxID=46731 RepID=UPI000F553984|nr:uncharacterized protein LOC113673860 [Pocillopora damicornis]